MAIKDVETLSLSILVLNQMQNQFMDYYDGLFREQFNVLRNCWMTKL